MVFLRTLRNAATRLGSNPAASTFLKRLADKVAAKKSTTYAQALEWLRCRLSFALLQASHFSLRGARSIRPSDAPPEPRQPDLAMVEAQIKTALVSFSWNNVYNFKRERNTHAAGDIFTFFLTFRELVFFIYNFVAILTTERPANV